MRYLIYILLTGICFSQTTHTFPALDTNNTFTGSNAFQSVTATQIIDTGLTAGVVCATSGGLLTSTGCSGVSGVAGTGSSPHIAAWTGTSTLGDTNWSIGTGTLSVDTGLAIFSTANVGSGNSGGITINTGTTPSTTNGEHGGNIIVSTSNIPNQTGAISLLTGSNNNGSSPSGSVGSSGALTLQTGNSRGSSATGDILVRPGKSTGTGADGSVVCGDSSSGSCTIVLEERTATGFAAIVAGAGVPSGNCQVPMSPSPATRYGPLPILYLRVDPASASTFLYVCIPPSTWTAVTVP